MSTIKNTFFGLSFAGSKERKANSPDPASCRKSFDAMLLAFCVTSITNSGYTCNSVANVAALDDQPLQAGVHTVKWNAQDDIGRDVGSGTCFYILNIDNQMIIKGKLLYMK